MRGQPLFNTIAALQRSPIAGRIQLGGLLDDDIRRLVKAIAGESATAVLVRDIQERTSGNPFFAVEISRDIALRGVAAGGRGATSLPVGIREAIGIRLSRLSVASNRVLATASVIGVEFSISKLQLILDNTSEEDLLTSLEEAVSAQIVSENSTDAGEFNFSHALIHEVLSADTSAARQARLHAALASKLEILYGTGANRHAAELEYHFRLGQTILGSEKAIRYSLVAGQNALSSFEYEQAAEFFKRGLVPGSGTGEKTKRGPFYLGLAEASNPFGDPSAVVGYLTQAFTAFLQEGNTAGAIDAAATGIFRVARQAPEQIELLRRGLEIVEPGSYDAARVLNEYGVALGVGNLEFQEGLAALEEALAIARREEDTPLEVHILHNTGFIHITAGDNESAVNTALEVLERAKLVDVPALEANAHRGAAIALAALGETADAVRHSRESLRLSTRFQVFGGRIAEFDYRVACLLALNLGQWEKALGLDSGDSAAKAAIEGYGARETVDAMTTNEKVAVDSMIERLGATHADGLFNTGTRAEFSLLVAEVGRRLADDNAMTIARKAAFAIVTGDQHAGTAFETANFALGVVAVASGDAAEAAAQYGNHRGLGGLLPIYARAMCPDRLLALLSVAMGDVETAIRHFEDALTLCEKAKYRPELAWCCSDYAETLLNRGVREDRERIIELVSRGLIISRQLDMRPLENRLSRKLELAEAIPVEPEPYPAGLTQREVEVLQLVAAGRSNRDIANELVITHNTVITHIRHILEKTDSANRSEAGAFAHKHELFD